VLAGSATAKPRSPNTAEKCQGEVKVGGAMAIFLLAMNTSMSFMVLKQEMMVDGVKLDKLTKSRSEDSEELL
jgi:hypothetical protein